MPETAHLGDAATTDFAVQSPTRQETIASGLPFALTGISR
jgi:hypothetical protein